jgi:hypothetical protein
MKDVKTTKHSLRQEILKRMQEPPQQVTALPVTPVFVSAGRPSAYTTQ